MLKWTMVVIIIDRSEKWANPTFLAYKGRQLESKEG